MKLDLIKLNNKNCHLFSTLISAGFPSPAEDYVEDNLDLHQHLVQHPSATFFVRVQGQSMIDAGIYPGDILIVDRALEPKNKDIVVAAIEGEFTVKRLYIKNEKIFLKAENPTFDPIYDISGKALGFSPDYYP